MPRIPCFRLVERTATDPERNAPQDAGVSGNPVSTPIPLGGELQPAARALSRTATAYFFLVVVAAAAVALYYVRRLEHGQHAWGTFALFAGAAALTQLFVVWTPRNQSYHTSMVFLLPAVLILPPELIVLVPLVQHIPEWLKERYAWYVQTFNIANYTLASMAAYGTRMLIVHSSALESNPNLREATSYAATALVFVLTNHFLLAPMMRLANGDSIRELALFSFDSLSTNLALVAVGVAIAALWSRNPWLVVFAVAPLVLIHRSLSVPQLQAEARIEAKTGLFNARHFTSVFADELGRAGRYERPLSLLMVDLDLLR
ncbi:MAG: hypothetical protein QOE29_2380, partial [Gaiellaceae bacterium]|nr:hypothetical protein [Gaiellaceae bacterium]